MTQDKKLREDWHEHYIHTPNEKLLGFDSIANYWLKVLHHEREQLIEEVEKNIKDLYKKNGPIILDCPENTVLDEALEAVISLFKHYKEPGI